MSNTLEKPTESSTTPVAATQKTHGEMFLEKVQNQFVAQMGAPTSWTPLQKALAQHLFVKMDLAFREAEVRRASNRQKKDDPPITWANVNMLDLANEAAKIVRWEIDAELPNHVNVTPYLNGRTNKYDISLSPGYEGVRHLHTKFAVNPPKKTSFFLVHADDSFDIDNSAGWPQPIHKRGNYFKPGEVIGGFGHIEYEDPRSNIVAPVEYREFEKAEKASKNVDFWGGEKDEWAFNPATKQREKTGKKIIVEGFRKEMQYKTVVLRVCKKHLPLDPAKINVSEVNRFLEAELDVIEAEAQDAIDENANQGGQLALAAPDASTQIQTANSVADEAPAGVGASTEDPGY